MTDSQATKTASVEGFILVGGRSSRMGRDKSKLELAGETFTSMIAAALSRVANSITLVGSPGAHSKLPGVKSVSDSYADWGALGGLHGALSASRADWSVVVACDLPFVTAELFSRLLDFCETFEAVAPIQSDGVPQPLCAVYQTKVCSKVATKLIEAGERKPIALLQSVHTRWVQFSELSELSGAEHFFDNINTPQDYDRAISERSRLRNG